MAANRDPERTKRLILDAAAAGFCDAGPAGARIDSIAAAAGVNKRMLYHYFGSKDGLFAAVLTDRLESATDAPVGANLAERLAALQRHAAAHPDSIRLLMWEALAYRDGEMAAGASRIAAWRDRIAGIEAAQQGKARVGVDAAQLQLTFAGLVLFPFAFPQLTQQITGRATTDPEFLDARSRFLTTLAALFDAPVGETAPPKPRFRLAARVTETVTEKRTDQSRRQTDSKTLK